MGCSKTVQPVNTTTFGKDLEFLKKYTDVVVLSDVSGSGQVTVALDCNDEDGDGYGVGPDCPEQDCNDNDALINPARPDSIGDGVDNNCDGIVDEGFDAARVNE